MPKFPTRSLSLAVALLLTFGSALRAADDDTVVKSVNGDLLKVILEEEGFRGITVDKANKNFDVVRLKMMAG